MARPRIPSRATGDLPEAIRTFCDREYFLARGQMRRQPFATVPPGESPDDRLLYTGTWARPLIEAVMRANVWAPTVEDQM